MRILIVLFLLLSIVPVQAYVSDRYLDQGKIVREQITDDDVLRIFVSEGFVTKIELTEDAELVLVGNTDLLRVDLSSDKRSVIINVLANKGKTNLIVDTASLNLNYEVEIGSEEKVDYRVWVNGDEAYRNTPADADQEEFGKGE
ncbi:MAG: hypothetical protein H6755_05935 [Candidatus Omnitrophica bacterium]|nr:hypothetical protein [Candidatus Omnitrophota bacterium]MCB9747934.1 hypothetical protein [Candidatus Omnitrophota bacterium]